MTRLIQISATFLGAAVVALLATPLAARFARWAGAVDHPGGRRVHTRPTPRCGGLAIVVAFWVGFVIAASFGYAWLRYAPDAKVYGVLFGGTVIALMGLIDDLRGLSATLRLAIQVIVAAIVVMLFGIRIEVMTRFFNGGDYIYLRWVGIPLTVAWIVLLTNAFNWIDGLDGLAAGIAALTSVTLLLMSTQAQGAAGSALVSIFGAALAGACIGFLYYNMAPARIFMSDSGAMFIGFVLACMGVIGAYKKATLGILAPMLLFGVPIYDVITTIWLRWRQGRRLTEADRGHIHHRLLDRGWPKQRIVYVCYAMTGVLCVAALVFAGR
ncbi:MAG: glycosyltransferase family 4 protein [Armatimonadota bacterium]